MKKSDKYLIYIFSGCNIETNIFKHLKIKPINILEKVDPKEDIDAHTKADTNATPSPRRFSTLQPVNTVQSYQSTDQNVAPDIIITVEAAQIEDVTSNQDLAFAMLDDDSEGSYVTLDNSDFDLSVNFEIS